MENITEAQKAEIQYVFDVLDVTGSGYLTARELSHMMRVFGYDNSEEEVQSMIDGVAPGGRGLNFAKFCAALFWKPDTTEIEMGDADKKNDE